MGVDKFLNRACKELANRKVNMIAGKPVKLTRLDTEHIIKNKPIRKFKYLLARLILSRLGDARTPMWDLKVKRWELWLMPNRDLVVRAYRPMPPCKRPIVLDYVIARVPEDALTT